MKLGSTQVEHSRALDYTDTQIVPLTPKSERLPNWLYYHF